MRGLYGHRLGPLWGRRFLNVPVVLAGDGSLSEGRAFRKVGRCGQPQLIQQLGVTGLDDKRKFLDSHLPAKYKNAGKSQYLLHYANWKTFNRGQHTGPRL